MEELSIERKVEEGVGFVVDGHNYGRLDRLSLEELATMSIGAAELAEQIREFREALRHAQHLKLEERAEMFRNGSNR